MNWRRPLLLFLATAGLLPAGTPARGQTINATVDPGTVLVTNYTGWGVSLCWWANICGGLANRTNFAALAFTTLKLNIVRYNIGGENPGIPDTLQYRARIPGFEPTNGVWNWNADTNQRWMLKEAVALGADHVEAFANSPPWWMTVSGSVTGATNSHSDNLSASYETNFADYLATVVSNLTVLDGIKFELVTPMNEPEGPWGYGGGQEGDHMDSGQQARMVNNLSSALAAQNLTAGIDAPETYDEPDAATAINAYGSAVNNVTLISSHAYGTKNPASLGSLAAGLGKPAWLAEYGDGDGTGMTTARRIHDDITGAGLAAWCYWQVVDNGTGWGFLYNPLDGSGTTNYTINEKFYVLGQFSEYVRPGCEIINVNDNYSLAAYTPGNQTLVIVALNDTSGSLNLAYNLAGFSALPATAAAVRTAASQNLAALPAVTLAGKSFSATLPADSVTTFVLTNVQTAPYVPPAGLAAVPGNARVILNWSPVAGATNYTLLRGISSGNETTTVATTTGAAYTDTGLANGTAYYYVVNASGPAGASLNSPEVTATPFAGPPAVYWTNTLTTAAQSWNVNLNWTNGAAYPNATQATAVVNAPITTSQTIDLNQTNLIGSLSLGTSGGAFNLAGNGGALTFANPPGQAALVELPASRGDTISAPITLLSDLNVSNLSAQPLTLAGSVAGTNNVNYLGTGTLILAASNTLSGALTVGAGTVKLSSQYAVSNSLLTVAGGSVVFDGSVMGNAFAGGGLATTGAGNGYNLVLANNAVTPAAIALTVGYANTNATYAGTVLGSGSLTKVGTGVQTIGVGPVGGANYTGATTLLAGTLNLGGVGSLTTASTLDISGNSGACSLNVQDSAAVTTSGTILIADGAGNGYPGLSTLTVKNNASLAAAALTFGGNYAGRVPNGSFVTVQDNGALTITGSFDLNRTKGGSTAENDALNLNGGTLTVGNFLDSASTGNLGSTHQATINFNGGVLAAGANDPSGSAWLPLFGPGYLTLAVNAGGAVINNNGYSITIAASLLHGSGNPDGGLAALGAGTLTLTGTNSYNGGTDLAGGGVLAFAGSALGTGGLIFDGGTLQWAPGNASDITTQAVTVNPGGGALDVNGNRVVLAGGLGGDGVLVVKSTATNGVLLLLGTNTSASGMTVAGGATLGGTGTISGPVTVNAGGALAPGAPLGALLLGNNLTLAAGSLVWFSVQHAPRTNATVTLAGTLGEGGTLTVSNANGTAFVAGDNFKLFSAAAYAGAFTNYVLPPLAAALAWNTSRLNVDGSLWVVSTQPPAVASIRVVGTNLICTGTGGTPGWNYRWLWTTNLALPAAAWTRLATNAFDPSGNFTGTNPLVASHPQIYYRLQTQ